MDINSFIFRLKNEFYKNGYTKVYISYYFNNYNRRYLIKITAEKYNNEYKYNYNISEEWLDNNSIQTIINRFLNK